MLWLIAIYYLDGPELSEFDNSIEDTANDVFDSHPEDTENNKKMLNKLAQARQQAIKSPFKAIKIARAFACLLYTSPSPRDKRQSRMPSSA